MREWRSIDLDTLDRGGRYRLLTGTVIPRPIAWVTTLSPEGVVNLAPFSQFLIVAVDPGLLAVSIGPGPRPMKDTLANATARGSFVINMATADLAEAVQASGVDHPPDVSEVDLLGLETIPSETVEPPRLAVSPVQFECRLHSVVTFEDAPNRLLVGRVVRLHLAADICAGDGPDPLRFDPLARIGGRRYARLGDIIEA